MTEPERHVSHGRKFQYRENRILAALPPGEFRRIAAHLSERELIFKDGLYQPDEPIDQVCFPDRGVCSVMAVMRSGATAEVGTIGNEGMTGVALFYGDGSEPSITMVQVPGSGRMLPARVFQSELARKTELYRLVGHYAHALMIQIMQSAACNALHPIERRACRWILMTHDRVFTDEFKLTHEFLGLMLGASRPHVSEVAKHLQRRGVIAYRHGLMTVLNRQRLEAESCECYQIISKHFDQFLQRLQIA